MKYEAVAIRASDGTPFAFGCDVDADPLTGDPSCGGVPSNWHLTLGVEILPAALPGALPWRVLDRDEAITACQALGPGYDLVTNDEWQTLARDIVGVAANWQEGVVGGTSIGAGGTDGNQLNAGHSDNDPDRPLAADENDDNGCAGTGQGIDPGTDERCPGGWDREKRTNVLSSGGVVWDLGGNLWELVKDDNPSAPGAYGRDSRIASITAVSHPDAHALSGGTTVTPRNAKGQFGPVGDYTSLQAAEAGALGQGYFEIANGAVIRSGRWSAGTRAGIFYVRLINGPASAYGYLGFRCVYHPI